MRRAAVLILALILSGATACADEVGPGEDLSDGEWCASLWEDGIAPVGWERDSLMRDCTQALDDGFSRDYLLDLYQRMAKVE